jgi:D-alanyl-D-alanine carboxypeptidase
MQEKSKCGLRKLALQKGRVYGFTFTMVILSMVSSCESRSVNGNNVKVVDPNLFAVSNEIGTDNTDNNEVIESGFNSNIPVIIPTSTPTPTPTPTVAPTPTLTPEEEALREYENCFITYDFCYIEDNHDRYIEYFKKYPDTSALDAMTYVNIGIDKEYYTNVTDIANPASSLAICNKYNKLPSDYVPKGYEDISLKTTALRGKAGDAYNEMVDAAKNDGLYLYSISSYRSYKYHEDRYNEKVRARGQADVDKTNARPGYSEHQTGLAADFISLDESFANTEEGKWLAKNAYKFGFILRYPEGKEKITGYDYEPWHFRYVGIKMATVIQQTGLTYDEFYARHIKKVFLEHPEASYLSGDEFYDKYLAKFFEMVQAPMDDSLISDINASIGDYKISFSNDEYSEELNDEVLVLNK